MSESERVKVRERGERPDNDYEKALRRTQEMAERMRTGPVVVRESDRPWQLTRQGRLLFYLHPYTYKDTPLQDWSVFKQDIRTHSGKHKHQGGLVIYVVERKGWSVVDGERIDWEKGDLLLLPLRPGGVEHQHFNAEVAQNCVWMAYVHVPTMDQLSMVLTQTEESPDYKKQYGG